MADAILRYQTELMPAPALKVEESRKIRGLKIITPDIFYDFRGEYVETFNARRYRFVDPEGRAVEFVADDVSVSRRGVLRGLHGDAKTWKLIQCVHGEIYLVIADMREHSDTYLKWEGFAMNGRNRIQVLVPAGCGTGHLCLSDVCVFSYKQSEYYAGPAEQFTVRWDDPKLNIYWPTQDPVLSRRDSDAPWL